jgi:hypothetical protein
MSVIPKYSSMAQARGPTQIIWGDPEQGWQGEVFIFLTYLPTYFYLPFAANFIVQNI